MSLPVDLLCYHISSSNKFYYTISNGLKAPFNSISEHKKFWTIKYLDKNKLIHKYFYSCCNVQYRDINSLLSVATWNYICFTDNGGMWESNICDRNRQISHICDKLVKLNLTIIAPSLLIMHFLLKYLLSLKLSRQLASYVFIFVSN